MSITDGEPVFAKSIFLDESNQAMDNILSGIEHWVRSLVTPESEFRLVMTTPYFNVSGWNRLNDIVVAYPNLHLEIILGVRPNGFHDEKLHDDFILLMNRHSLKELYAFLEDVGSARTKFSMVHASNLMHAKVAVLYRNGIPESAWVGSANLTNAGLNKNSEVVSTIADVKKLRLLDAWLLSLLSISSDYSEEIEGIYRNKTALGEPEQILIWMLMSLGYGKAVKSDEIPNNLWLSGLLLHQLDGAYRLREIVDKHGGAILSDEVGLGKTFTAGALIRRNAAFNNSTLIVCPASIILNWEGYIRRFDLSKTVTVVTYGKLKKHLEEKHDAYAMVVFDEAHLLRNAATARWHAVENIFRSDSEVSPDVLLLTATPINNKIGDLQNPITMFVDSFDIREQLGVIENIEDLFRLAVSLDEQESNMADESIKQILAEVMLKRNREFIKKHYSVDGVLIDADAHKHDSNFKFPDIDASGITYHLNANQLALVDEIVNAMDPNSPAESRLTLAAYQPQKYLKHGVVDRRENSINHLMRVSLLKALESSPPAFIEACERMANICRVRSNEIRARRNHDTKASSEASLVPMDSQFDHWRSENLFEKNVFAEDQIDASEENEYEVEENSILMELKEYAKKPLRWSDEEIVRNYDSDIDSDKTKLDGWVERMKLAFTPNEDEKAFALLDQIEKIRGHSQNGAKVLIFAARYASVDYIKRQIQLNDSELVVESINGSMKTKDRNSILDRFSPISREGKKSEEEEIDVLVTTDVLAEGVNLQQAQNVIHYDLPWNPMRMLQRTGRIDRIGSPHDVVYSRHFTSPEMQHWLNLTALLERKLNIAMNSVGAQSPLDGTPDNGVFVSKTGVIVQQGLSEEQVQKNPETLSEWLEVLHLFVLDKAGRGTSSAKPKYQLGSGAILTDRVTRNSDFIFVARFEGGRYELGVVPSNGKMLLGEDAVPYLIQAYERLQDSEKGQYATLEDSLLVNHKWYVIREALKNFDAANVSESEKLVIDPGVISWQAKLVLDLCSDPEDRLVLDALLVQQRKELAKGVQLRLAVMKLEPPYEDILLAKERLSVYAYKNRKLLRRRSGIPKATEKPAKIALWMVI